jgi:glycosyltransferase involved in cell wall biosynthesis
MKVGFFLGGNIPQIGGNFTFEDTVFNALLNVESQHEFYVFYYGPGRRQESSSVTFVPLSRPVNGPRDMFKRDFLFRAFRVLRKIISRVWRMPVYPTPLERASREHQIELMWFLTHRFEEVSIPFATTVLDLAHRTHPFFPEVSAGGLWENREEHFRSTIPKAAYVITGTEAGKMEIMRFYHVREDRVKVLPFPVIDFTKYAGNTAPKVIKKFGISSPYLFYPAQFWPHKNHVVLLQAVKLLKEKYSLDFSLVFTGSDKGNMRFVKEKTAELGLEGKVHFLGFVSIEDLIGLYQNAFAMTYVSFFGPDNLPPLEAFALGCAVIAGNSAGAVEQMGDAALLIDQSSENQVADAVKRLHDAPEVRRILIEKGRSRIVNLSTYNYVNGIVSVIDEFASYRRCWSNKDRYVPS